LNVNEINAQFDAVFGLETTFSLLKIAVLRMRMMMLERITGPTGLVFPKKNLPQKGKPIKAKTRENHKYKFL
jgi:hypothetical protein